MARVSDGILSSEQIMSVTLDRYQELMRICPCSFNGVKRTDAEECCDCDELWTQSDRDGLAIALKQAEEMREAVLGYSLSPKYFSQQLYEVQQPVVLRHKFLETIGVRTTTLIQAGVALTLRTGGVIQDPVIITLATTLTIPSEIHVYYPGESVEIKPSSVAIASGVLTIKIPRCRLLLPTKMVDCDDPLYEDDANFLTSVDVYRVYMDTTQGAEFVWNGVCCDIITPSTQTAMTIISNARLAILDLYPATYSTTTGEWTLITCSTGHCGLPSKIRLSYTAGRSNSSYNEMQTIHLAHTLLPSIIPSRISLCNCWKEDLTEIKGINTPYGNTKGSVNVWMSDSLAKIGAGGMFPGSHPRR